MNTTIPLECYWVLPGRFLAGEFPGERIWDDPNAPLRIGFLLEQGVDTFIDLTMARDVRSYEMLLRQEAGWRSKPVNYLRCAIPDYGVPAREQMAEILNALDQALAGQHVVYVHCQGGIGRTGTVVGCYLVRHGMSGRAALQRLSDLRQSQIPGGGAPSPESDAQWQMVLNWPVGA